LYRIAVLGEALKDFAAIPKSHQVLIRNRIRLLSQDPRPNGAKKLQGKEGYRVRQGSYRILYQVHDRELLVTITGMRHRREAYRP
jgi:mRNA interferase RelE/StbE